MKSLVKQCALCDNTIPYHQIVCKAHKADGELYDSEEWFVELVKMQQRQYEIDMSQLRGSIFSIQSDQKSTKTHNKLKYHEKKMIRQLSKQGLGWRRIAKQLQLPGSAVNKYLYRLRKSGRHSI